MKLPIALQLYSVREETEKDFIGTLEKVAEIGYKGVEFAGFGGLSAVEAGTAWLIAEQDQATIPSLESVRISFENLKKLGLA